MIDIALIRKNSDEIRNLCLRRNCNVDIDQFVEIDQQLRENVAHLEDLRRIQKSIKGREDSDQARSVSQKISELQKLVNDLEAERNDLWARLPNLLAPDTPEGEDDTDNVELSRWGEVPRFDFEPKTHEVIGAQLDILDLRKGGEVAGSGFYFWKGAGARLTWAVFNLAIEFLVEQGFVLMFTPVATKEKTLFGTGYLPFFSDQIYKIEGADLSLIGTSEQTLIGYHENDIIPSDQLPLLYTAFTPCFRTEAGSYGRKSRGAFRVHQFHKVEQIVFCNPQDSEFWHQKCLQNIERFMQLLEIPYRVVRVCLGDLGAPAYKKYDVEAWFSGFGEYRETHSNTNLLDYQTRRLGTRSKLGNYKFFPHTISATMITDRAILAILENNQQVDGSVVIPKSLRKYLGGQERIAAKV